MPMFASRGAYVGKPLHVGPKWLALIPEAARALEYEDEQADGKA